MRSAARWFGFLCLFLLGSAGQALGLTVFEDKFDSDLPNFTSYSDWERSYCSDNWRTDLNGGVIASRDDSCPDCGCNFLVQGNSQSECISSDPFDNHIQSGNVYWQNYVFSVRFRNADDDTLGVVFRYNDSATFYLFTLSRDVAPAALSGCDELFAGASLLRVRPNGAPEILAKVPEAVYSLNTVHAIEVAVQFNHIIVHFDADGDGTFSADEKLIDLFDDPAKTIPNGRIGLYAYENGVQEDDSSAPPPCAGKGCWFDDVRVDILPPTSGNCGAVGWEGLCDGNTLKFCDATGKLQVKPCAEGSCCRWVSSEAFYSCVPATQCGSGCKDACAQGEAGCSANLDAKWICGSGDADACKEPQFTACPAGSACNPATGQCQTECIPVCDGKECGPDGCGGLCGHCSDSMQCQDGKCFPASLGQFGDPCSNNDDCANKMCVGPLTGKICSKACAGNDNCPEGFECIETTYDGNPVLACFPAGTCTPQCQNKQCGSDGCGGQCGGCPPQFECVAALCKALDGATCQSDTECAGGLCIPFQAGLKCSGPCITDAECPQGWSCAPWLSASMPGICSPPGTMVAHKLCKEVADCVGGCPPGNGACVANCFFLGSKKAQSDYADLWVCSEVHCLAACSGDSSCMQQCLLDSCFQEFATCFPGSTSCKQALDCMAGCSGSETCASNCFDDAFPAAKKQLLALLDCLALFCNETSPPNCIQEAVTGPCAEAYASCSTACTPVCDGLQCGPDGCGGDCGPCAAGKSCESGQCIDDCTPECAGKSCGDDGCGSVCGVCDLGLECQDGKCIDPTECKAHDHAECVGNDAYWFDSCGARQELLTHCPDGCKDGACAATSADVVSPSPDVIDSGSSEDTGSLVFSAGKKGSSCSAAREAPVGGCLALLALLALFWTLRFVPRSQND
jgi:hypothetical protein